MRTSEDSSPPARLPEDGTTSSCDPSKGRVLGSEQIDLSATAEQLMAGVVKSRLFGDESPPPRIGRFEVRGHLGQGGMGLVVRAWDPTLEREVAIKLLRRATAGLDTRARNRIEREAKTLARLNHPNIVHVYEYGEHEGRLFIVMEWVQGESLDQWLLTTPSTLPARLRVLAQAARGLAAGHAAGIVHRDFKPANLLVGADRRVRVVDFGIAREPSTPSEDPNAPLDDVTRGAGTPAYMAPEQIEGGQMTPATDAFAFGVVLYEVVTSRRPFEAASVQQIQERILNDPPALASAKLDDGLASLIEALLDKQATSRAADLNAIANRLESIANRLSLGSETEAVGPTPHRRRQWGVPTAVLAAVGLTSLGATVWQLNDSSPSRSLDPIANADVDRPNIARSSPTEDELSVLPAHRLGIQDKDATLYAAPDGGWIALQGNPGSARVWHFEHGQPVDGREIEVTGADAIRIVGPSTTPSRLHVIARMDGVVKLGTWDLESSEFVPKFVLPSEEPWFEACTFYDGSPNGEFFARVEGALGCGNQGAVTIHDLRGTSPRKSNRMAAASFTAGLAWGWSPDSRTFAIATRRVDRGNQNAQLLLLGRDAAEASHARFVLDVAWVEGLAWSRDGLHVGVSGNGLPRPQLRRVSLDDRGATGGRLESVAVGDLDGPGRGLRAVGSGLLVRSQPVEQHPVLATANIEDLRAGGEFELEPSCSDVLGWNGSTLMATCDEPTGHFAMKSASGLRFFSRLPVTQAARYTWSAAHRQILGQRADAVERVFEVLPPTGETRHLASTWKPGFDPVEGCAFECAFDRCIAVIQRTEQPPTAEVYEVRPDGNVLTRGTFDVETDLSLVFFDQIALDGSGKRLAWPSKSGKALTVLELDDLRRREVTVDMPEDMILQSMAWRPDGRGLVATGMRIGEIEDYRLFDVSLDGRVDQLWSSPHRWLSRARLSADGTQIAVRSESMLYEVVGIELQER